MRILCAVPFLTSAVKNGPLDVNGRERHVPAIASKRKGGGTYFSGDEHDVATFCDVAKIWLEAKSISICCAVQKKNNCRFTAE